MNLGCIAGWRRAGTHTMGTGEFRGQRFRLGKVVSQAKNMAQPAQAGTQSYRVLVLGGSSLLANERYVFQTIPQQFTLQDTEAGSQIWDTAECS